MAPDGLHNLAQAKGLKEGQLFGTIGNGLTMLPSHVERPETWPDLAATSAERRAPVASPPQLPRTRRLMSWL